MRKLLCTLALAALMASMASQAQAREGWYVRGDLGYSVDGQLDTSFDTGDVDIARVQGGPQALIVNQQFDFDDDFMADVGVGHSFGNGFRLEGELAHRRNDISGEDADIKADSLMFNGFYDFNHDGRLQPYLGVGAGYARVDVEDENDSSWAWQAMAGVAMPINDKLTFDAAYRLFRVEDLDFSGIDADYEHQAVTVGLRYQFGAAAAPAPQTPSPQPQPPAPAAAAVCPTSQFTVYFEWDRSNLNQAATEVIDQAVARAHQCNVSAIEVVGHTDTSGSDAYNMGLSERRAGVVRDALVARGLQASSMTTQAQGETHLARQTADGVREPLNRRTAVTITFH
jgi:outer membrane protein OmpA-like peptidoglycan-associated protein